MHYGFSYYPEHKSPEELEHDLHLIVDSGATVVRMGEFAWKRFEKADGLFDFSWLDPVVDTLWSAGISSIICTPSACPPSWLWSKFPDLPYVDNFGRRRPFGGRRQYCYSHREYRSYCARLATRIGEHYGSHPGVLGFQIDNELAQEGTGRCRCPRCISGFRLWLERKYGSIQEFNRRSGGIFWDLEYDTFEQIQAPIGTIEPNTKEAVSFFYENPTLRLDFERFSSEAITEFQDAQTEALKAHTSKPVTTNGTGVATNSIDYYRSYSTLDVYGYDLYPSMRQGSIGSFSYAHARGVKNAPFWVMEIGSGGGHGFGGAGRLQPYPGALGLAAVHAASNGADLVAHFQFRTFPFGAEQLNYAIVDADGIPRRRYREFVQTSATLQALGPILDRTTVDNQVALLFDYQALWATRIKPVNTDFSYEGYLEELYNAFSSLGVGVDVVPTDADLSRYRLVVLGAAFVMDEGTKARLVAYVKGGGAVLGTFLSAAKGVDNNSDCRSLPSGLTELFGLSVEEVEPVFQATPSTATTASAIEFVGEEGEGDAGLKALGLNRYWTEVLSPDSAGVVARYADGFRAGLPFACANHYGSGLAFYLGGGLDAQGTKRILSSVASSAGVGQSPFSLPTGVQLVRRREGSGDRVYWGLFNFREEQVAVPCVGTFVEALVGGSYGENILLPPKGYLWLTRDEAEQNEEGKY